MEEKVTRKMPYVRFAPGNIEIDEFDCASVFLFTGTERALLLDTGTGIGDLKGLAEELTDLPYDVVITHGHMDHVGGCGWFDRVWMNEKELKTDPFSVTVEKRNWYAELIRKRTGKTYPYDPETDIRPWPGTPEVLPLHDGKEFDLGGRKLVFYECPGHSPGEMVMIDEKNRILFAGDACNNNLLFRKTRDNPGFISVEEGEEALERIYAMRDRYDHVMNSHHDYRGLGEPLADSVLPNAIRCMKELVEGKANVVEMDDPLNPGGKMKVATVDGKSWVAFHPEGILKKTE